MILLEFGNRIIAETLKARLDPENKPDSVDITVAEFDGVIFHLSNGESKTKLVLSISIKCFAELQSYGVDELLNRVYGQHVTETEAGFNFSIQVDLENPPADVKGFVEQASLMKRHCFAAPFERAFALQEAGGNTGKPPMVIPYRQNESIYVQAEHDRVTVIFSTIFSDADDIVIGKVFLQEFADARRNVQNAPQVLFSHKEPPRELEGTNAIRGANIGYVTFVMFPRHYRPAQREQSINLIETFRDYLHYHIKCSKAYLHSRMRARVTLLLKILNRARPENKNVEKKTMTGKTFKRT